MFLSAMALSNEINQDMIFPTQYIKGLLIKIYNYAIWRNAIWHNVGDPGSGFCYCVIVRDNAITKA